MKKSNIILTVIVLLVVGVVVGAGIFGLVRKANQPGKYDTLAQCISDSGAKFYGAFWCPHCQATKAMFGKSAKLLPYVECSKPSGQGQLPICDEQGIKGYPTWRFADKSELGGERSLAELADKTNCSVPTATQ